MPRSRGAVTGVLLILLGVAAALAPLLGPEIGLTIGSDKTMELTRDRLILSVIPGAAVAVGGLLLLVAANRPVAMFGGLMALAGGIWLVVGPVTSRLWEDSGGLLGAAGRPDGDRAQQTLEVLTYFHGIGAIITALAGIALGRLAVKAASEHRVEPERERPRAPAPAPEPRPEPVAEEPRREPVVVEEPRHERVVEEEPRREEQRRERAAEAPHREPVVEATRREPAVAEPPTRVVEDEPRHQRVVEDEPRHHRVVEEPATQVRTPDRVDGAAAAPPAGRSGGLVGRVRDRFS